MIKQTLRSCGSIATKAHMERVSLCALFLLEACKLIDSMFGATRSTHHTTTSAKGDIEKLVTHLHDYLMVMEQPNRKEDRICLERYEENLTRMAVQISVSGLYR